MEELRREARRLEHALDSAMVQFGRLDLSEPGSSGAFEARAEEIEGMLQNLQDVNDQLSRQASSATGSAASTMHVLQRHREILHDFMQEFSKTKHNLKLADERQQLLSSVREDIIEHRSSARSATDTLLRERNAIHNSDRAINEILGQAESAKFNLNSQRTVFYNVGSKLGLLSDIAPKINNLISSIGRRKSRDKLIMGLVVGGCTSLFLLYSMS